MTLRFKVSPFIFGVRKEQFIWFALADIAIPFLSHSRMSASVQKDGILLTEIRRL